MEVLLLEILVGAWVFFLGASLGSFANVVAWRMPRGMSFTSGRSHCPHCGQPVRSYDNIPIVSWLILRGRCRDCASPIPIRYWAAEVLFGAILLGVYLVEVRSGGANLPDNPAPAAVDLITLFSRPPWPILAVAAWHAVLLCLLATAGLMRSMDRSPPVLYWFLCRITGLIVILGVHFLSIAVRLPGIPNILNALPGLLIGEVLDYLVARSVRRDQPSSEKSSPRSGEWRLVGLSLGWTSLVVIAPVTLILTKLTPTRWRRASWTGWYLLLVTILFLSFWREIDSIADRLISLITS